MSQSRPPTQGPAEFGFGNHVDVDRIDYTKVSQKSVVSAVLGCASLLALVSPLCWVIPLLGAALAVVALREIRASDRPLVGRAAARAGLALALLFGTAGVSRQVTHRWWVERDARQFGQLWFELLNEDQPQRAYQLNLAPTSQQPLESDLWEYYRNVPKAGNGLKQFVQNPFVRTLLALQGKAEIRFWEAAQYDRLEGPLMAPKHERIGQYYVLSYTDKGRKTTFFARLDIDRIVDVETHEVGWRIVSYQGGVRPVSRL